MADTHDKKSHDYASNKDPYGNYHFAGLVASLFSHSHKDAGFASRIAEKIYRLSNIESNNKIPNNEGIDDTEKDIATITALWMSDRRDRRRNKMLNIIRDDMNEASGHPFTAMPAADQANLRGGTWEGFPKDKQNPLMNELLDLIKLMPDHQTQEIIDFIMKMREIRKRRDADKKISEQPANYRLRSDEHSD